MNAIKKIALSTCVLFTCIMGFWAVCALPIIGADRGIVLTISLLAASLGFALLQFVWFTDHLIKTLVYPARILGFGITALVMLSLCAWAGSWLPQDEPSAWLSFVIIYLVIFIVLCIGYQIYFRKTVGSFDAALDQYHKRMNRP